MNVDVCLLFDFQNYSHQELFGLAQVELKGTHKVSKKNKKHGIWNLTDVRINSSCAPYTESLPL